MAGSGRHLLLLLKLAVAAALTGLLVYYASPSKIVLALRSADVPLVLTFVPLTLVFMWLNALQLKILTDCHGMGLSVTSILRINTSAELYNLLLPGPLAGGAIRWYRLSRDNRMRAQALAVIGVNRLLNVFVLLVVGVLGWLLEGGRAGTGFVFWFLMACLLALTGGFLVLSNRRIGSSTRARVESEERIRPFLRSKLLALIDATDDFRRMPSRDRLLLGVYTISWNLVIVTSTWLLCLAVGISVPIAAVAWMRAVVSLALLLPLTISGFGIREGGWIYLLGLYGVAPEAAFAMSLLTFVRTLFIAVLGLSLEIGTLFRAGNA